MFNRLKREEPHETQKVPYIRIQATASSLDLSKGRKFLRSVSR